MREYYTESIGRRISYNKTKNANWNCHILRRNCLLKHIIEGKIEKGIEGRERQGRGCKRLLDDFRETKEYWQLKEEALDRPV